jgi:hypothetical protein
MHFVKHTSLVRIWRNQTSCPILEALSWSRLRTPELCWSSTLDEHSIAALDLSLSDISKTRPKETFFINEIDTLTYYKKVPWALKCIMYNPTTWMTTFSLWVHMPWFILEALSRHRLSAPSFFGPWNLLKTQRWFQIWIKRSIQKNTYTNPISWRKLLINRIPNYFIELFGAMCSMEEL